jgi:sugar phosphate isomerase/epimerase
MGRPLKFESLEALEAKIEEYFNTCPEKEWTITGLGLALDTSRETLMNYEDREDYFDAIKKAKDRVHNAYEKDLRKQGRSGDIFALKNFGWSDKQEIDHTTKGETINSSDEIKKLTAQLNDLHRSTSVRSDGTTTNAVDTQTQNKE